MGRPRLGIKRGLLFPFPVTPHFFSSHEQESCHCPNRDSRGCMGRGEVMHLLRGGVQAGLRNEALSHVLLQLFEKAKPRFVGDRSEFASGAVVGQIENSVLSTAAQFP